jgi:C1A family cysteine protease
MLKQLMVLLVLSVFSVPVFGQTAEAPADQRVADLQKRIDDNGFHWTAKKNAVAELPREERLKYLGYNPPKGYDQWFNRQPKITEPPLVEFPAVFDWRDSNIVTPVKNQAGCGSCWAFGATGAFEAAVKKHDGIEYDLSEQQALSCNIYGSSCAGGWAEPVYELFRRYGAVLESCMPYQANDQIPCTQAECLPAVKLKGWQYVDNSVNAIKQALLTGPVCSAFQVYDDFFSYSNGCYQHTWGGFAGGHIITLVGWDDNACDGQGAWLCKNSWGPGWGSLGGYFWIKWGETGIGSSVVLPIYPPDPVLLTAEDHQIFEANGDGDGIPDPGEIITLSLGVMNSGLVTATGVQGVLSTTQSGISIIDSVATFPDIMVYQTKTSNPPNFSFKIDSAVDPGMRINFSVRLSSGDYSFDGTLYDYVGKTDTVFVDKMENGANSWTHGGTFDDWQLGKPMPGSSTDPISTYSGDANWGNNLSGNYAASAANYLESPVIDCRGVKNTRLSFYRWLAVEKGIYDVARVLVNGNAIWTNDADNDLIDTKWLRQDFDLSTIADNNPAVKVRFELTTDVGLQLGGWSIDDFSVMGIPTYLRGDANHDGLVNITDAVSVIDYVFGGGVAPNPLAAGDADCDGMVNVSDAVYLVVYVFGGGPAPCGGE